MKVTRWGNFVGGCLVAWAVVKEAQGYLYGLGLFLLFACWRGC